MWTNTLAQLWLRISLIADLAGAGKNIPRNII